MITLPFSLVQSGLLAGVAAQLYSFFKDKESYSEQTRNNTVARDWIVACCYCALFFNIGAAISGFLLIDGLGELQYRAASSKDPESLVSAGHITGTMLTLLQRFSGGGFWGWLIFHCMSFSLSFLVLGSTELISSKSRIGFLSFCFGAISLLVLLCAYVLFQERVALKIVAILLSVYIIIPALGFTVSIVFSRKRQRGDHGKGSSSTSPTGHPPMPVPMVAPTHAQSPSNVPLMQDSEYSAPPTSPINGSSSTITLSNPGNPPSPWNPHRGGRDPVRAWGNSQHSGQVRPFRNTTMG
jgi:hypothetical protein